MTEDNSPVSVRSPDGSPDDAPVEQMVKAQEITPGEERLPLSAVETDNQLAISALLDATYKHEAILHGRPISDKAFDVAALKDYLASLHEPQDRLLAKLQEHTAQISQGIGAPKGLVSLARA